MVITVSNVLDQNRITDHIFRMRLHAETIARESRPGQFVHMRVTDGIDPLLRRPFSIHRVDREEGVIELLYRVVGRGSEMMSRMERGDKCDLMGPLGNGFDTDVSCSGALIIAGGMGIAPVFFLIDALLESKKRILLLWGARTSDEIFDVAELEKRGVDVRSATEDGSLGLCGLVTDLLDETFQQFKNPMDMEGFVCGPKPMLRCVQDYKHTLTMHWQVSMEEHMACGMGVCMGCGIKLKNESFRMARTDGPVFDLAEVELNG